MASIALATFMTLLEEKLPERAARMGRRLMDDLRALQGKHGSITEVRGKGLLIGVEMTRPVAPLVAACRERGLLMLSAGDQVLRLAPPLIVDDASCDRALEILGSVLQKVEA